MKTTLLHTAVIAAALLFLSGMAYEAPAAKRRPAATPNARVTGVPAPVVDDSPINPDTAKKVRIRRDQKNDRPAKKPATTRPPKRRAIRR
jgi:hypothetical protein